MFFVLIFVVVDYVGHLLVVFQREGSLALSFVTAAVLTCMSFAVLVPAYRLLDAKWAILLGVPCFIALFMVGYTTLFVPSSLTMRQGGMLIFDNGTITWVGAAIYMLFALPHAAVSVCALLIAHRYRRLDA